MTKTPEPVALLKTRLEIVALVVLNSVEETTPMKLRVLVLVAKVKVEEPAKVPPSLYCTCPVAPPGVPPVEVEYLFPLASSRIAIVAFVPVALVKVIFVEETVVAKTLVELKLPASVSVPVAEILNWVEELTWKSMKLPTKVELGFEPIYVPVVLEFWIVLRPSWKKAELVEAGGMPPVSKSAVAPERVDWRYPVAPRLVDETDARDD